MINVSFGQIKEYLKQSGFKGEYYGLDDIEISGFCSLNNPKKDCITWIKKIENNSLENFDETGSYIIVTKEKLLTDLQRVSYVITDEPKAVFFGILDYFWKEERVCGIADSAIVMTDKIGEEVFIGENSFIGEEVFVGNGVRIGNNCSVTGKVRIGDNTVISDSVVIKNEVQIGSNCVIQAMVVIGEDGFGYYEDKNGVKTMIRHHGGVKIGKNVFVGSHTNIARGTLDNTVIGEGVKIAPSSHIGHNNYIEKNVTFICSQSYGSVHIKENAYIVGSVIKNQSVVGRNTLVGMGSVVTKDVGDDKVVYGAPAKVIRENK